MLCLEKFDNTFEYCDEVDMSKITSVLRNKLMAAIMTRRQRSWRVVSKLGGHLTCLGRFLQIHL